MARYPSDRRADIPPCTGVLLVNVGTPEAPTPAAVRRYLAQFLADPRMVELPRLLWWPLLYGLVLPTRATRSAAAYKAIWSESGSPLLMLSERLAEKLQRTLERKAMDRVKVALAMRYGKPTIAAGLEALRMANMERLLVFPLYPQYAAPSTGSAFDGVTDCLKSWRRLPEIRLINGYHDHPAYIRALVNSVRTQWAKDGQPERLLFSFHGLPQKYALAGDPYRWQCEETAKLVAGQLKLADGGWGLSYQSRFGPTEWLKPYTDQTLREWVREGIKSVAVVCPGFTVDCLETLEEVNIRYRQVFLDAGGEKFSYIPALNESEDHVDALVEVVMKRRGRAA
ncbi:MAG: ferrochelatase [Gammaproteobacteria bacterium]